MSRNHCHCIVVEKLPSHRHEKLPSLKPNELIFESTLWWPWAGIKLKGPHQIKWNLKDNEYHNIWIFNFQMNQFFQKISSKIVWKIMWHSTQILALFWLVVEVTISWWIWNFLGNQSRDRRRNLNYSKKHLLPTIILSLELITSDQIL